MDPPGGGGQMDPSGGGQRVSRCGQRVSRGGDQRCPGRWPEGQLWHFMMLGGTLIEGSVRFWQMEEVKLRVLFVNYAPIPDQFLRVSKD